MRYKEINLSNALSTCDICYKTECDFIRETGESRKFWDDKDNFLTLCDVCKKREEKIENGET